MWQAIEAVHKYSKSNVVCVDNPWEIVGAEQTEVASDLKGGLVCSGCVREWLKWTFTVPLTPGKVKEGGLLWANIRRDDGSIWHCMFAFCFRRNYFFCFRFCQNSRSQRQAIFFGSY